MDGGEVFEISPLGGLDEIPAADWDRCAAPEAADGGRPLDPFTTHRFLKALEDSGSVGPGTGWQPHHLAARLGGRLLGVMPLYAKGHSQGEYVFDHSWAHAYERAGGRYYPKLQAAVPFTPATGRRFLTAADAPRAAVIAALAQGAAQIAGATACPRSTSPSAPRRSTRPAANWGCCGAPASSSTGSTRAIPASTSSSPPCPRASASRSGGSGARRWRAGWPSAA